MLYIIDANNLAGRMGILEEENFDKILITDIGKYFSERGSKACLVFDSSDPVGDKYQEGNLEVVIAPHDDFYQSADDKIVEIAKAKIEDDSFSDQITLITDDQGLVDRIIDIVEENEVKNKVIIEQAAIFIEKINKFSEEINDDYFAPRDLETEDMVKIDDELNRLWN